MKKIILYCMAIPVLTLGACGEKKNPLLRPVRTSTAS